MHPAFLPSFPLSQTSPLLKHTSLCKRPPNNRTTSPLNSFLKMSLRADLDHIALDCKGSPLDLAAFYTDVFGFAPYRVDEFRRGKAPFPSVRVSPITIIDFFPMKEGGGQLPKGLRQSNHFCFSVSKPDYENLMRRFQEKNVEIIEGPVQRSGAKGDGMSIYVKDPDANTIEFRYYPEEGDN